MLKKRFVYTQHRTSIGEKEYNELRSVHSDTIKLHFRE